MSWEAFELGLRVLQHEEGRQFLVGARAVRVGYHANDKTYGDTVKQESAALGVR